MSSLYRLSASASALALLIMPVAAHAEEDQSRSDIVVTASLATDEARREIEKRPGGVDLVEAAAFEDKVAVSLRDALAFSPGVYTQPRFGQEVRLSVRGSGISRGFHMRGLTLLQDGIPINLADDNGDFQELDPQVFQRIEVYRGGNALRFGGSTLGGAINAVTPTGRTAPRVELRIDGGSFSTVRAKAAAAFATERGDAYLALTTDSSDGDRAHAKRDSIRFNGNVGLRLNDVVETRFYAMVSHINQDLPGSLTRAQALSTPTLSLPGNITGDQERDIDSIRLQNRTTVDLQGGQVAFGAFFNAKKLFHPIFQVIDQNSDDYGVFANVDLAGGDGGLPWELTLGTQARFGKINAKQFVNVRGDRGAPTARTENRARTINSYGELRLIPITSLTLVAGGIYTSGSRDIDNRLVPARSGKADFDLFAPKVGLLYEPVRGVQFYANYNRSVELPGYSELSQTPASGLPGFTAVRPQKAWTVEIGTRGQLGMASWDLTFYRADLKGEMLQYAVAPDFPASTFNAGRTRHQGIEAGLDLALAPWARLRQVYQLNDFRFRRDVQYGDNRLPVVPQHQYRADIRLGTDAINVTPNLEWLPKGAWADYRNTVRAPGYTLFGIGAEARVRDGITLFIDARNITGKKAIGDISAVLLATPATVAFYPVERRAFYGGLRASF
ncbi:TonB-dependent receptor [Sphingomonadaceae bacterium G21617-S1]|nr:TonB-dependent receptor [Sphingomonadaceae bacterium G21617-S1]